MDILISLPTVLCLQDSNLELVWKSQLKPTGKNGETKTSFMEMLAAANLLKLMLVRNTKFQVPNFTILEHGVRTLQLPVNWWQEPGTVELKFLIKATKLVVLLQLSISKDLL